MANRAAHHDDPVLRALERAPLGAALSAEERAALDQARADDRPVRTMAAVEKSLVDQARNAE